MNIHSKSSCLWNCDTSFTVTSSLHHRFVVQKLMCPAGHEHWWLCIIIQVLLTQWEGSSKCIKQSLLNSSITRPKEYGWQDQVCWTLNVSLLLWEELHTFRITVLFFFFLSRHFIHSLPFSFFLLFTSTSLLSFISCLFVFSFRFSSSSLFCSSVSPPLLYCVVQSFC